MSVHPTRRPGPLPSDLEFAALDHSSSGWSAIEQLTLSAAGAGGQGGKGKGKGKERQEGREGEVEIVPTVRMGAVEGLDGVRSPSPLLLLPPKRAYRQRPCAPFPSATRGARLLLA